MLWKINFTMIRRAHILLNQLITETRFWACPGNRCASNKLVLVRKYQKGALEIIISKSRFESENERMHLTPAERRRSQRIHVQIAMFIRGVDAAGVEFIDLTKTLDISSTGAYLASLRLPRSDQLLNLTIPAPPSPSLRGSG